MASPRITKSQYESLAAFRYELRRFLRFSEEAAANAGLTAQQHQALLAIKGYPDRDFVSISELADRLQLRHHSTVGLVNRLEERGLVSRSASPQDKRRVEIRLTRHGETVIRQLSAAHLLELRHLVPEVRRLLESIVKS
jgi:DNA-binding MarR family transcriptional regulator